ncbi:uncharacterized protein LOC142331036 isoform X4 [Lycorma delicatula]|uniref:uncharacterized protein LOC142331036 isoform X4 n=1 Tax=Lycorma delicatula TaxID=130591 RepID=UPI003F5159EC
MSAKLWNNIDKLSQSVSSLQKIFDCPICLDMLEDPIRTTVCGHTFCKKCINRVLKSDCKKKPCPLCNASLTHRSITSDEKTSTFLQLTVELITAINLDTGNNILEYRRNFQSTNEASQDSEKLFQPKGSHRSPLNNHKQKKSNEQNKAQNDNNNDVNEIINKKCKNDKTKINIKDYLTKKHKKIKDKKQSTINDHIKNSNEFKKPLKVGFEVQDNRIRNKNIQSSDCNNDLLSISDVEKQDDVNIDIVTNNEVNQITLEGDSDSTKCMVVDSSFVVYNDYIKGSIENKAAEDLKNKPSCNVPFILLGSLVGQHERMQKNNNLVQFVLCGSLNKERKKRKFDEYNDSIDENQQHRNCLVSFNHKRNLKQDLSDLDKSVIRKETTGNNQHKMNSSSSSIMEIMGTQQRETLEKECTELRKKIEIAEKELENDASLKDNGIGPSNVTMIKEVAVKHNSRPTIIEASDNDDEYEDIEENISPTPPSVSKNSDLELNLRWQQSQRIVQMSPSVSEIVPDFETNEVPTSVNDSNFVKTYNSTVMNRSLNEIPSSVDLTDTDNSNKIKSPHINNKTNKLNVLPNLFVPSEKECSSSANHVEIAKLDGSEECVKINSEAPSSMSFVYSRLSDTQLKELKLFAFHLNADITNNITDGMTTHVIISPENGNRAPHTFKYLKGVASRLWVVSTNWISDSLKAGKLLPEEDYLVLDSSGEPGPLRCKQIDNPPPLSKFIVVPHPPYTSTTIEQVNDLIILCGGEIVSLDVLADVKYKSGVPRILLIDSESDNIMIEMWLEKFRLVPLNVEWLLEIAGRYMLVPISGFMIAPYPKLLLQYLSIPDELIDDDIDEDFEDCEDEGTNE